MNGVEALFTAEELATMAVENDYNAPVDGLVNLVSWSGTMCEWGSTSVSTTGPLTKAQFDTFIKAIWNGGT